MNEEIPELIGEHCVYEPSDGQFDVDIRPGMDVAVYTQSVKDRPWLGRVQSIQESGARFEIQWFKNIDIPSIVQQGWNQNDFCASL